MLIGVCKPEGKTASIGNRYATLCPSFAFPCPVKSVMTRPAAYRYFCLGLSMSLVGSYVALSKPWRHFSCHAAGLAAVWHRCHCHAGMAQAPRDETPLIQSDPLAAVFESFFGNFFSRSA
jgi:hypothetical protein